MRDIDLQLQFLTRGFRLSQLELRREHPS